jgi:hypothetical protein
MRIFPPALEIGDHEGFDACSAPINGLATSTSTSVSRTIDHAKSQYVVGAVHTNTIEGF